MSGVANNAQGSTIFTENTVEGGPNDVTVNNCLVQGNLTVLGSTNIATIDTNNGNFDGNVDVGGDVDAVGNVVATGVVQADSGIIVNGTSYINGDVVLDGNLDIPADGGSLSCEGPADFHNGVTIENTTAATALAVDVTGDSNFDGDIYCTGNMYVEGDVVANNSASTAIAVTTNANIDLTTAGTGYVVAELAIPSTYTAPTSVVLAFYNVSFDLVFNTAAQYTGFEGKSGMNLMKFGICQLPWNGNVDSRFQTAAAINYQWKQTYVGSQWVGSPVTPAPIVTAASKQLTVQFGQTYGIVAVPGLTGPGVVTNARDSIPDDPATAKFKCNSTAKGNSVPATVRVQQLPQRYQVGQSLYLVVTTPSAGTKGYTATISAVTTDATYAYYTVAWDSFNNGAFTNYVNVNIFTSVAAKLQGATAGPITADIVAIQNVSATRVVDVGKTLTLNSGTNVLTSSATLGANNVQNVAGTQSFSVDSVAQLNAGFTTDRRQAVLNANAPTGANPFATIADVIAGGGAVPGGTVTGAVQFRSSTGTFTADNNFTYDSAAKRQRIATAGSTVDVQPTAITMSSAATAGAAAPMLKLENTNTGIGSGSVFIETYKNKNGAVGDVVGNWSCFGKNASGNKREFSRISTTIRQAVAGIEDGSVSISAMRDNVVTEYARFNGNEGQTEFYQPVDMNSNNIVNVGGITGPTAPGIGSTAVFTEYQVKDPTVGAIAAINYNGFTNTLIMGGTLQPGGGIRDNSGSTGANQILSADSSGNLLWIPGSVISYGGSNGIQVDTLGPTISIVNTAGGISFVDSTSAPAPINGISVVNAAVFQPTGAAGGYFDVGMLSTSGTSGGNTGLHLPIRIGGTQYKIRLEAD